MSPHLTEVRATRQCSATPERVFDAWFDADHIGEWLFSTPSGQVVRVEMDARVGGTFVVVDRRDGVDISHFGTYTEIDRPRKLAFDFSVMKPGENITQVFVNIAPANGGCEVTLVHGGVPAEMAERSQAGWVKILDGLERTVS